MKKGLHIRISSSGADGVGELTTEFLSSDPAKIEQKVRDEFEHRVIRTLRTAFKRAKNEKMVFKPCATLRIDLTNYINYLDEEKP